MTAYEQPPIDQSTVLHGILAEFTDAETLVSAARAVRETGLRRWDSYSPFPVHGIDGAMGIRPTILPWLVLGAGIAGAIAALLMQWWMNSIDYPLNISGKPLFSLPANIPVAFELIILFSALTAFVGVLVLNGLPHFNNPLLEKERFLRVTTDRFFIAVDARDPEFEATRVREMLQAAGATSLEEVHGPSRPARIPLAFTLVGVVVVSLALIPPLWIAKDRRTKSDTPRMHPVRDMDVQPKFQPQAATPLYVNGQTMRLPVAGTIAYGELQEDEHFAQGVVGQDFATTLPAQVQPVTMALMTRGRERYRIYCVPCHGLAGEGDGITSERALARQDSPGWVKPLSLHSQGVREQPVGKIYNTISNGIRTMPPYGVQIAPRDRWAIVVYILALQRSQNALLEDLPPDQRQQLEMRDFRN
ncbi:MAG: quinol:electron acceptor oxidoreductase subunit ActD [Pirellulaceae bacterium]